MLTMSSLLLLATMQGAAAVAPSPGHPEHRAISTEDLEHAVQRACAERNQTELERLAAILDEQLETAPTAALHHLRALTLIAGLLGANGNPDARDPRRLAEGIASATQHLQQALEPDTDDADAAVALAFVTWMQFMLPDAKIPELVAQLQEARRAGLAAEPDHPYLAFLEIAAALSGPDPGPPTKRLEEDAFALAARIEERFLESEAETPEFWDLMTLGMLGRTFLFLPEPRPGLAARLSRLARELDPDFAMARDFLAPFVAPRTPMAPAELAGRSWRKVAEDAEGDGLSPVLPDATGLELDEDEEALWVRIPLASQPPSSAFGINLLVERSDPEQSSSTWWGSNPISFTHLVTVWVSRDREGQLRGAVGVAEHGPAYGGAMTGAADGSVGFALDASKPAFVLRVPWSDLPEGKLRIAAAVGSNAQWNDDVPQQGTVEVSRR